MSRLMLFAVAMLWLSAGSASAQSFDCRRATSAYEHALCENPELGKLDETLATAWATAIGGLSKPATEVMRSGQRQWLDYIQRDCSPTGEVPSSYGEDGLACLQSDLYNRIRGLEESRMRNGWRIYLREAFSVSPAAGSEEWDKPATRALSYPQIDAEDPVAAAFNAFARKAAEAIHREADAENAEDAAQLDLSTTATIADLTERRMSLRVEVSWYGHGAAHPNYTIRYRHYLADEERDLEVSDIFAGRDWQEHLAGLVTDALKDQLGDVMWEDAQADIAGWAVDPERWNFSQQGLVVQFQPYEVAAYAFGAVTVTIPWERLGDDLTADARSIAGY